MLKMRVFLLPILLLFLHVAVFTQNQAKEMKNPSQFRQKLDDATRLTNSIESTFSQEKNLSVLSEKIKSSGKFFFQENKYASLGIH